MQQKRQDTKKTAKPRRKLTRAERKQIEAVVRQAKGDGKAHTVQDSIPLPQHLPGQAVPARWQFFFQDDCLCGCELPPGRAGGPAGHL